MGACTCPHESGAFPSVTFTALLRISTRTIRSRGTVAFRLLRISGRTGNAASVGGLFQLPTMLVRLANRRLAVHPDRCRVFPARGASTGRHKSGYLPRRLHLRMRLNRPSPPTQRESQSRCTSLAWTYLGVGHGQKNLGGTGLPPFAQYRHKTRLAASKTRFRPEDYPISRYREFGVNHGSDTGVFTFCVRQRARIWQIPVYLSYSERTPGGL